MMDVTTVSGPLVSRARVVCANTSAGREVCAGMTMGADDVVPQILAQADWTRRLARALVSDEALADDLVQETWAAAVAHPPAAGAERGWIRTVLRNALYKRALAEQRRRSRDGEWTGLM